MSVEHHHSLAPGCLGYAVITVSDSRRGTEDTGGQTIVEQIADADVRDRTLAHVTARLAALTER